MTANQTLIQVDPSVLPQIVVLDATGSLWIVSGRRSGQDEDHMQFLRASSMEQACRGFEDEAYRGMEKPEPEIMGGEEFGVIEITSVFELGEFARPDDSDDEFDLTGLVFGNPDRSVDVTLVDGTPSQWLISPNLTDRWGGINDFDAEIKPLPELVSEPGLLHTLRSQMTSEITFAARKDGLFGLLFEVEMASIESEINNGDLDHSTDDAGYMARLKPHSEVVAETLASLRANSERFPHVSFCMPDEGEIANDRPAVWGFMRPFAMNQAERDELAAYLCSLSSL
ncbi:hypothetical protein [Pseudomonas putida]|uniref:Uncharacterized protein n=1 Tax=Pseudomonas putida TaxID=303 RepID=A0A8I1ED29_PSEPU|nr:hypothetical protein [Pseudomonas putida]MBI6883048.1 hypothetical protein [Pseudomonas putida]